MADEDKTRRPVEIDDPDLSPEANRLMTEEARDALGGDEVEAPAGHDPSSDLGDKRSAPTGTFAANRFAIAITFLAALVIGAIIALVTESWIWLGVALVVHAIGTFLIAGLTVRVTAQVEKPSATTVARLEEEGVADPERAFDQKLKELSGTEGEDRTVTPEEDPAQASGEQRRAVTPASESSSPRP